MALYIGVIIERGERADRRHDPSRETLDACFAAGPRTSHLDLECPGRDGSAGLIDDVAASVAPAVTDKRLTTA
jgi:hypothetical protein